jgi:hypothetical protein
VREKIFKSEWFAPSDDMLPNGFLINEAKESKNATNYS